MRVQILMDSLPPKAACTLSRGRCWRCGFSAQVFDLMLIVLGAYVHKQCASAN